MFRIPALVRPGVPIAGLILLLACVLLVFSGSSGSSSQKTYPEIAELDTLQSFDEYKNFFVDLAQKKGALYAFDVLKAAPIPASEGMDPAFDIHRIAHAIGYVHYKQKGLAGIHTCTTDFQNACQHAIVVQAIVTGGESAYEDIATVCTEGPGGLSAYINCFHGVGHGVLAYFNYDYKRTIGECRTIAGYAAARSTRATSEELRYECIRGASMELTLGEHDLDSWKKAKEALMPDSDILMPCDADFMDADVRPLCYVYISRMRFLKAAGVVSGKETPEAISKALSYCMRIPEQERESRNGCFAGFGATFTYLASGDSRKMEHMPEDAIRTIHAWCALSKERWAQRVCALSALDNIFWGGETEAPAAPEFCTLAPDADLRERCYSALVASARLYVPWYRRSKEVCGFLPEPHRTQCMASL